VIDCWHGQAVEGQAQSVSKAFTGSMAKAGAAVRLKAPYLLEGNETLSKSLVSLWEARSGLKMGLVAR
jgi:hypothetical protein